MIHKPEEWRPIPSFSVYEASSWGRIRSKHRELRSRINDDGYRVVNVYRGGVAYTRPVHVLVCEAFHGPKPAWAAVAAHNNGRKLSNWPANIRWSTTLDNNLDKIKHGTQPRGESHPWSTFTETQIKSIRAQHAAEPFGRTVRRLAEAFDVSEHTIRNIVNRKTWKHLKPARRHS